MQDIYNSTNLKRLISPVVVTDNTAQTSQVIDARGFDELLIGVLTGTLSDADTTVAVVIYENDANSTSGGTQIAAANHVGSSQTSLNHQFDDDNEVKKAVVRPTKRYVYIVATPSNNTGNIPITAFGLLHGPQYGPATQSDS